MYNDPTKGLQEGQFLEGPCLEDIVGLNVHSTRFLELAVAAAEAGGAVVGIKVRVIQQVPSMAF